MKHFSNKESFECMIKTIELLEETIKLNNIEYSDSLNAMLFMSCFGLVTSSDNLDDAKKTMIDYLDKMHLYRIEIDKYTGSD